MIVAYIVWDGSVGGGGARVSSQPAAYRDSKDVMVFHSRIEVGTSVVVVNPRFLEHRAEEIGKWLGGS